MRREDNLTNEPITFPVGTNPTSSMRFIGIDRLGPVDYAPARHETLVSKDVYVDAFLQMP